LAFAINLNESIVDLPPLHAIDASVVIRHIFPICEENPMLTKYIRFFRSGINERRKEASSGHG